MKKWNVLHELRAESGERRIVDLIDILLENRGIKTKKDPSASSGQEREDFLNPKLENVTPRSVGIDTKNLAKALKRIKKAIENKEQIIVFGDYDVDGITGSAILWETIHTLGGKVLPYIPHRVDEGYGLSIAGISNIIHSQSSGQEDQISKISGVKLIITVDNGIVAHEAVEFANKQGIDVIISDHHVPPAGGDKKLPDAYAIVHTTKLCGAGVAYLLSKEIKSVISNEVRDLKNEEISLRQPADQNDKIDEEDKHLELAALGTIADMVPLTGGNRTIVKYGLEKLPKTKRLGLIELYKQAGLNTSHQNGAGFTPYDIGFIIAPRLNASGRIESAMDSLRLLCTTNRARAEELAAKLELVNKERQQLLKEAKEDAILKIKNQKSKIKNLLFIAHESYAQGIIGLVAGKLVEEFYRPAIVVSIGEKHSKASVRSISGFNIIEFLRLHSSHFINVGGHPMAAGFTVETEKITILQKTLEEKAEEILTEELLIRSLKIDCELDFSSITKDLYDAIQTLAPFGMGNPEPVFATKGVTIEDIRIMGKEGTHLKLVLSHNRHPEQSEGSSFGTGKDSSASPQNDRSKSFEAVAFGMGALAAELHIGDKINVAYTLDENTWLAQRSFSGVGNGNKKLQLKIKDLKKR